MFISPRLIKIRIIIQVQIVYYKYRLIMVLINRLY